MGENRLISLICFDLSVAVAFVILLILINQMQKQR